MAAAGCLAAATPCPVITGIGACIDTDVGIALAGIVPGFSQAPGSGANRQGRRWGVQRARPRSRGAADDGPASFGLLESATGKPHHGKARAQGAQPRSRISHIPSGPKCTSKKISISAPTYPPLPTAGLGAAPRGAILKIEAGGDDMHETKAKCRSEFVWYGAARRHEEIDDGEAHEEEPRRPAQGHKHDMGARRPDGAAGIGRRLIDRVGRPAGRIGGIVTAQAQTQEHDRQGERDQRRRVQHSLAYGHETPSERRRHGCPCDSIPILSWSGAAHYHPLIGLRSEGLAYSEARITRRETALFNLPVG